MVSDRLQCATISSAIASGLTQVAWSAFGISARLTAVSMVDGQRAMTEMLSFFTSSARATVNAATAALAAVYAVILAPCRGLRAGRAAILTICPPRPALRKLAIAARQLRTQETRFIETC